MKLRRILLLSLGMALCAGGGVGVALAAVSKNGDTATGVSKFDKAIYLYWGHESETATLGDINASETAQYKYLEVSPKYSATLSGTVTVHFALTPATGSASLQPGKTAVTKGITVRVLSLDAAATSENYANYIASATQELVVAAPANGGEASGNVTFDVGEESSGIHETVKKYAIEVVWAPAGVSQSEQVAAYMTISQSFAADAN